MAKDRKEVEKEVADTIRRENELLKQLHSEK